MKKFREYLDEHVLSIGLNPKHEKYRKKYEDQMHDALRASYAKVDGGYDGKGAGTKEEEDDIRSDIRNPKNIIKATRRGDKITSVSIYKRQHGRKMVALGTDDSKQGKSDIRQTMSDDNKKKRAWGEVSGNVEKAMRRIGHPVVSSSQAKRLTGKNDVETVDNERYTRKIGRDKHTKTIMGHPKDD